MATLALTTIGNALGGPIAALMQDQLVHFPRGVLHEGDRDAGELRVELGLGFRDELEGILTGRPCHQASALARDGKLPARR